MQLRRFVTALAIAAIATAIFEHPLGAAVGAFPTPPPIPSPRPVTEAFFGQQVTDPYRYFENMSDPSVQAFFRDQNTYARAVLARLDGAREHLFRRIEQLDNAGVSVDSVMRDGPYYFYMKLVPGASSPRLYVRNAAGTAERVLVDPGKLASLGKHYSINYFLPSLDGTYVAYGVSEGGSEASVIHVVQTATGRVLTDAIDRAYFVGATSWLPDGKSFYYVRFPKLKPGEAQTDKETRAVAYLHVLGRNPDNDVPVFGYGVDPSVTFAPTDFPIVLYSPASPNRTIGYIAHGVKNEVTIYAARTGALRSGRIAWTRIATDADDVTGFDTKASTIYLLTHKNAPTYRVVSTSLDAPDLAHARSIVEPSASVVEQIGVAADGLYVRSRDGGFGHITRIALAANGTPGPARTIALPYRGDVDSMTTDPRVRGATIGLTGWTHSLLYYAISRGGRVADTRLKPLSPVDESSYTSDEVEARSADGTMIPLSLVYRRGLRLDGSHPTYLEGYGAYGITIEPAFSATRVAWMEHGGVYAVCHARGGGWYGEAWHKAGMIATKHHTWEDFIACGQWLVAHHYTSPQHLAGEGTSAGGITIGRAITTRPHLFAAALDVVGVSNAMRSEFTPNGPPNIPEFGSVTTEAGFHALYAMDAYQHVVNGTKYPAVMLITGYNDPRVSPWELAKFAARLETATTSGRPILLRVDYDAGHGFLAASRAQTDALLADEYAFLLWQCGDPAFAGLPIHVPQRT